jgi:hypothetical protein
VQESDLHDAIVPFDIYDLPTINLLQFDGLIVSNGCDQEFLLIHKAQIHAFLDAGKVLSFSGHLFRPWLPGAGMFQPKTIASYHDYVVRLVVDHPIFAGVLADDLTFRKGVAGFFARGHHEAPAGAEIIAVLPGDEPIVYIDRASTRGTILVHAGNDLLASVDRDSTAGRIAGQLLRWMLAEAAGLARTEVPA